MNFTNINNIDRCIKKIKDIQYKNHIYIKNINIDFRMIKKGKDNKKRQVLKK